MLPLLNNLILTDVGWVKRQRNPTYTLSNYKNFFFDE